MDSTALEPLPVGFQRVGAFGVALAVPADWNPVLLEATGSTKGWFRRLVDPAATGIIALSDLHGPRLEVRWRTLPGRSEAEKALQRMVARLKRAGTPPIRHGAFVSIPAPRGTDNPAHDLLASIGPRLYELHLPPGPQGRRADEELLLQWFLRVNTLLSSSGKQYWSLYGAEGWAPRDARVRRLKLQPGRVEVALTYHGGRKLLGSQGLADHLLQARDGETGQTLLGWAREQGWAGKLTGNWADASPPAADPGGKGASEVHFSGIECHHFGGSVRHLVRVRHDPASNRIAWEHTQSWGGHAVLNEPAGPASPA